MRKKHGLAAAALLAILGPTITSCGNMHVAHSQTKAVADAPQGQGAALDAALLAEVDTAIGAARARGENTTIARTLRDSAVDLAARGFVAEANGNLKAAAASVGVLAQIGGEEPVQPAALPVPPKHTPSLRSNEQLLLDTSFNQPVPLDGWQPVAPPSEQDAPLWEVRDGFLAQRGIGGVLADDTPAGLVIGEPTWRDVTVTVTALARDTKELGVIIRQQGDNYYRFRALVLGTGTNSGNYLLEKVTDGDVAQIASFSGAELSANTWHTLQLAAHGHTLTATVDGVELGSVDDSAHAAGRIGVSTLSMSGAYFARVRVTGRP